MAKEVIIITSVFLFASHDNFVVYNKHFVPNFRNGQTYHSET